MHYKSGFLRRPRLVLTLATLAVLTGCAGDGDEIRTEVDNITEAYELAQNSIKRKNYRRGIQIFEIIQARFPFSDLARQIQLELMHAYYKSGQREQAIEAAETFIRENPIHARVDYALYIKGLSYYERGAGLLERWFRKDTSKRPPKDIELAYSNLRRLVERYPGQPVCRRRRAADGGDKRSSRDLRKPRRRLLSASRRLRSCCESREVGT